MNKLEEQQLKEQKQRQDSQHKKEMRKLAKQRRKLANTKLNRSIKNLKELWSYAVFRWCVYQTPLLVFGFMLRGAVFHFSRNTYDKKWHHYGGIEYNFFDLNFYNYAILIWVLILASPAVWVWRKPLFSWLNKKAEED